MVSCGMPSQLFQCALGGRACDSATNPHTLTTVHLIPSHSLPCVQDRLQLSNNTAVVVQAAQMTTESIRECCVANGGYRTPCLNEKLYLHFKGYVKIENLEEFSAAKCIWLEANGLQRIENLEPCKDTLRQL